ncbi:MAG: hypothetical protein IPH31_22810 [Lewinellaceae bacterium]|nr:hypothetical protein [Lewinellaceae bacterium]
MGRALEYHRCKAFIGFDKDSILASVSKYDNVFMACENYCIKKFLEGNLSILESFNIMNDCYSEQIYELYAINTTAAAFLLDNRNALVMYPPDANFTLQDFSA